MNMKISLFLLKWLWSPTFAVALLFSIYTATFWLVWPFHVINFLLAFWSYNIARRESCSKQ